MFARRLPHGPGFVVVEDDGEVELSVTGPWTSKTARIVRSGRIDRVVLNYARGFREPDIEFLRGLPIRGLHVMSYTLTDLSPIYSLSETLTSLSIGRLRGPIDLERLPRLRTLSTDWNSVESTVQYASGIEKLHLEGYRAHDLRPLSHLTHLNLRLGLPRHQQEQLTPLVLHGGLRHPRQKPPPHPTTTRHPPNNTALRFARSQMLA